MPESPLVSVIIPVYNGARFLPDSVGSVTSQSYDNVEVVIVNDGSTDDTDMIATNIQQTDPRIKYIRIENSGVSCARKTGILNATGRWICFLDVDDRLPANAVETYSRHTDEDVDIIATGEPSQMSLSEYKAGLMRRTAHPELWGKLFRTEFIKKYYPEIDRSIKIGEDQTINLVLANHTDRLLTIPQQLYCYNTCNPESVTKRFRRTNDYELKFEQLFNNVVKSDFDSKDELLRYAEYKMKIEGFKMIILDGNRFDNNSNEWRDIVSYYKARPGELATSEKFIINLSHHQWLYGLIMRVVLLIKKRNYEPATI